MTKDIQDVNREYSRFLPQWNRCRTVIAGSDAVKKAGETFLPRLPGQSQDNYDHYRERAAFFNVTRKTLDLYTSMVFSKTPVINGISLESPLLEDADLKGTSLIELLENTLGEVIGIGRCGILVDFEGEVPDGMSLADAAREDARPFLTLYKAEDITDWHRGRHGGKTVIDRVVLREMVEGNNGEDIMQYRELFLSRGIYHVRIWRPISDQERMQTWQVIMETTPILLGEPLNTIPFFFFDPALGSPECQLPPLLDLVDINISHYRTMADLEHGRFHSGLPTPIFAGFNFQDGESIKLGSMEGIASNLPEAKAYYLEFSGQGLAALENAARQKEAWMVQLGSGLLDFYKSGKEATETLTIRRSSANTTVGRMAMAVSQTMTKAVRLMARWAGLPDASISIQLPTEYLPETITPQEISVLLEAVQTGNFRRIDWLYRLKTAGILSQDQKPEHIEDELYVQTEPVGFKTTGKN